MQSFCNFLLVIIIFCISQNLYAENLGEGNDESVILKADLIKYDDDLGALTANGNVYISMENYILRADNLYYDIKKDVLFVEGNLRIKDEEGKFITGQRAVLKDKLKKGIIDEFILRLPDDSLLTAAYGNRHDTKRISLHKANFTPCKVFCGNRPIWQIKAKDTDIDYKKEQITHKNMFFEVFGIPVAYFPYFFHPTPAASAKSGILVPQITRNQFTLPLYYRAKSNMDLTLTPHMSKNYTRFEGELRHLIKYGNYQIQASYANHNYSSIKEKKHLKNHRYTIFTSGSFYKDGINYGFDINRASDKAYLVNDFENHNSYLESKVYVNKIAKTNYLSLEGYAFQDFRPTNIKNTAPLVFPRARVQKVIALNDEETTLFKIKTDSILHNENYNNQIARNALELNLSRKIITQNGHLFNFAIANRNDLYWISTKDPLNTAEKEKIWSKNIPEIHAQWRYPLIRNILQKTALKIEPIIAAVIGTNYSKRFNKFTLIDTDPYELSEYNLFHSNRFSGIDCHDYGKRISYGVNTSLLSDPYYVDIFLGQLAYYNNFSTKSNLAYVGNASIDIASNLKLYYRFRKDKKLNSILDEAGISSQVKKLTTSLQFSKLSNIAKYYSDDIIKFPANKAAQMNLDVSYQLFDSLSLSTGLFFDITKKSRLLYRRIKVTYTVDCVSITGDFYDNFTHDSSRDVKKNSSKTFAIRLKVLNM